MADNLLQEVDEALRADRAAQLWHKYRKTVITLAVALVLGTAINSGWQHYRQLQGGKLLVALTQSQQLLETGKPEQAAEGFGAIAAGHTGEVRDLARVWQARALVAAGKKDAAVAILKTAATEGKSLWADIACMRLAGLDAKEASCLAAPTKSPLAAERAQWAAAGAWANGEQDLAIASLEKLVADDAISEDSRARLTQWLAIMKAEKGKK